MWIKTDNDQLERVYYEWMDKAVEFSSNGTAQVSKEDGERLVEEKDFIEKAGNKEEEVVSADPDDKDVAEVVDESGDSVEE